MDDIEYDLRIGRTKFREWMKIGWMPQPYTREGTVTRWLASEIDEYLARFPHRRMLAEEQREQSLRNEAKLKHQTNWNDQRPK
jgi:predicted DNA-binding transcriptional regulator AlpA